MTQAGDPPCPPPSAAPLRQAIEALGGTLTMARLLAASGRRIDLGGLDAEAASLCAAVGLLPLANARPLRPALEELLREVDGLRAALAVAP